MASNNRSRRPFPSFPSVTSEQLEDLLRDKLDICLVAGFIHCCVDYRNLIQLPGYSHILSFRRKWKFTSVLWEVEKNSKRP